MGPTPPPHLPAPTQHWFLLLSGKKNKHQGAGGVWRSHLPLPHPQQPLADLTSPRLLGLEEGAAPWGQGGGDKRSFVSAWLLRHLFSLLPAASLLAACVRPCLSCSPGSQAQPASRWGSGSPCQHLPSPGSPGGCWPSTITLLLTQLLIFREGREERRGGERQQRHLTRPG